MIKISVVISIYMSHGFVKRQISYLKKLNLGDDVEFIFVDDGSTPPLSGSMKNLTIIKTGNKLAWTQGLGRNLGAQKARGEYLFMTDIDHIISKDAFDTLMNFTGPMMRFERRFGVLDENGNLFTDLKTLKKYGLKDNFWEKRITNVHRNTFAIKREIFNEIGGYKSWWCEWGFHPQTRRGDDCYFDSAWREYAKKHKFPERPEVSSFVYVFPIGRFRTDGNPNPDGLFHNLGYRQEKFFKP